jgi:hydroxymethylbilane synthase
VTALRLGTRGSPLALAQAAMVAAAIEDRVETVIVTTSGDLGSAVAEDKRRWVDHIERALSDEQIDLAVHSAKDVPALLADGLELIGSPQRADPRDALCGAAALDALPAGARVGTSSLRREAQLRALREDICVVALHGNLDTRLSRLHSGDFDAIVVARAGLERLGRDGGAALDDLVPAAGQGTLTLEGRHGDQRVLDAVAALRHPETEAALLAERACVHALGAGCHTPVGVHAQVRAGGEISLRAFVGRADGSEWVRDECNGRDPVALGRAVAGRLLSVGAATMLAG